jgi:hypothetical protein
MSIYIIIPLCIIAVFLCSAWKDIPLPLPFRNRACQGTGWRRAFPKVSKQNIRKFLALFVEAFAFKASAKLQFNPDDKILDIYRSLYPHKWQPDSLEVETLAKFIEETYHVSFNAVWSDRLTLGELFAYVISSRAD